MYYNNTYQQNGMGNMYGGGNYYANQPFFQQQQPNPPQSTLTKEDLALLNKGNQTKINLHVTKEEQVKYTCNHVSPNDGQDKSVKLSDDVMYCKQCDCTWDPNPKNPEDVKKIIDDALSLLQNIKWVGNLSPQLIRDTIAPIMAVLNKIPEVYDVVLDAFYNKHNGGAYMDAVEQSIYGIFNSIARPGAFAFGNNYPQYGYQQQAYAPQQGYNPYAAQGQVYPQQGYTQQGYGQQYAPQPQQMAMPSVNPMDSSNQYVQPQQMYQPQQGYTPQFGAVNTSYQAPLIVDEDPEAAKNTATPAPQATTTGNAQRYAPSTGKDDDKK